MRSATRASKRYRSSGGKKSAAILQANLGGRVRRQDTGVAETVQKAAWFAHGDPDTVIGSVSADLTQTGERVTRSRVQAQGSLPGRDQAVEQEVR